jgi:exodeoxyribonuclease VII small subunit
MSKENEKSLREMIDEFEKIAQWFDEGELDVEAALKKYDEASALAAKIEKRLADAKNKIEIVNK